MFTRAPTFDRRLDAARNGRIGQLSLLDGEHDLLAVQRIA